ncbi:MAG: hypothetical protein L0I44_13795 [Enterococcus sp.]|mgnify:FL=1|nr:hypothetical protein [Enterococcus sp.]
MQQIPFEAVCVLSNIRVLGIVNKALDSEKTYLVFIELVIEHVNSVL